MCSNGNLSDSSGDPVKEYDGLVVLVFLVPGYSANRADFLHRVSRSAHPGADSHSDNCSLFTKEAVACRGS